jgi:hypothetical protein
MKTLKKLFPVSAAALAAGFLLATPQLAHAQWWTENGAYGNGIFNDHGYYPNYSNYYSTNFGSGEWNGWWGGNGYGSKGNRSGNEGNGTGNQGYGMHR